MSPAIVVVTGANGLVGSHVVSALGERGATVRAVVRRVGTAPQHPGVEEHVGDFADSDERRERGYKALDAMEEHLGGHAYFVGERYSIADIALYAYTHVADEGGFDLSGYPGISAWLSRVAAEPGHITIDD